MKWVGRIFVCFVCWAGCHQAMAEEFRLQFVPSTSKEIPNLKWDMSKDVLEPVLQLRDLPADGPPYYVVLKGTYSQKDRNLLFDKDEVKLGYQGDLRIELPVESEKQEFEISEVDPSGIVKKEKLLLLFPNWEQFQETLTEPPPKKWTVVPNLGWSLISYTQSGEAVIPASVNELVLSLKVSGDISLGGEWQLKGSVFGTGLPVWANPRGSDLYFFGASLGLSRSLPLLKNPWSLKLMLGGYYTTTFTTGVYGYTT